MWMITSDLLRSPPMVLELVARHYAALDFLMTRGPTLSPVQSLCLLWEPSQSGNWKYKTGIMGFIGLKYSITCMAQKVFLSGHTSF